MKIDAQSRFNVLIVDDDIDLLNYMEEEFKDNGHHVTVASSGNKAIELLKRDSFDVIVSDFKMPNGTGLTILNFVNTMKEKPMFFFVSAQSDLSIEDCIKLGAHQYYSKPFDFKKLVDEVEKELEKRIMDRVN